MKQIVLFLLLALSISVYAQDFCVKSFTCLPMDMAARKEQRIDQNGNIAALIRVKTNNEGFTFDGGIMGIVDIKQESGEVFVWVPSHSRKLTIRHPQLGVLRDYYYPIEIEGGKTYELCLSTGIVSAQVSPDINESGFEHSRNVTIYDKEGNPFTLGLLITTTTGAWIRIQKGPDGYEQYSLIDADKNGFTHMTNGKSEIEPLYVK